MFCMEEYHSLYDVELKTQLPLNLLCYFMYFIGNDVKLFTQLFNLVVGGLGWSVALCLH